VSYKEQRFILVLEVFGKSRSKWLCLMRATCYFNSWWENRRKSGDLGKREKQARCGGAGCNASIQRMKQENHKFKTSLGNKERPCFKGEGEREREKGSILPR
jgi:hypothetical protein